jgi:hypothetical protein
VSKQKASKMAVLVPLVAGAYLLHSSYNKKLQGEAGESDKHYVPGVGKVHARDGREKLPKSRGQSQVADKVYLDAVRKPVRRPHGGPSEDERHGIGINKQVPLQQQRYLQHLVWEARRSGGVGEGSSKAFLLREKWANGARRLQFERMPITQPGGLTRIHVSSHNPFMDVVPLDVPRGTRLGSKTVPEPLSAGKSGDNWQTRLQKMSA